VNRKNTKTIGKHREVAQQNHFKSVSVKDVVHRRQSVYNIVKVHGMARLEGTKIEARKKERDGVLGEGCFTPQ